jgi:hypothetical protein
MSLCGRMVGTLADGWAIWIYMYIVGSGLGLGICERLNYGTVRGLEVMGLDTLVGDLENLIWGTGGTGTKALMISISWFAMVIGWRWRLDLCCRPEHREVEAGRG